MNGKALSVKGRVMKIILNAILQKIQKNKKSPYLPTT